MSRHPGNLGKIQILVHGQLWSPHFVLSQQSTLGLSESETMLSMSSSSSSVDTGCFPERLGTSSSSTLQDDLDTECSVSILLDNLYATRLSVLKRKVHTIFLRLENGSVWKTHNWPEVNWWRNLLMRILWYQTQKALTQPGYPGFYVFSC